jgi:4,5-DOPA dioxygenase extradiol
MTSNPALMPAVFFGHGNPLNAIQKTVYSEAWSALGRSIPTPKAILCISAHWYLQGTRVTAMLQPRTIHDFGGFPAELYQVKYPAPGDPELAQHVADLLRPTNVKLDEDWGLDHGTWSVLCHAFPDANIPVVQLSIDETKPAEFHYSLAQRLMPLREQGVLIVGSGNIVHNLHSYAWGRHVTQAFDWATSFEDKVKQNLISGTHELLVEYETLGREAQLAVPTPEHYLPLLYIVGLRRAEDELTFPVEGMDGGSISMLSVKIG